MKRILCILLFFFHSNCFADLMFQPLEGKEIPYSSLKGKWVFINYWASWCSNCVQEIPALNQFFNKHKNTKQVEIFAVNYDRLTTTQQKFLVEKYGIEFPSLLNNPARELALGPIVGVPLTFVINPEGELVNTLFGGVTAEDLEMAMVE